MIAVRTLGVLEVRDAAGQPVAVSSKPAALLVFLALSRPAGPQRRDRLLALLYPDTDETRGRNALRQLLAELRARLGPEILTDPDRQTVTLVQTALACDVWEFERAVTAGDFAAAVAAYGGPFLEAFHLPGCPEFEEWSAAERMRLRRAFTGALEQLALRASAEGRPQEAADWWRQLLAHEPYASSVTLGLMEALARAGDRAGALEVARAHAQRLREELGATPSVEVEALAEQLQARPVERTGRTPTVAERLSVALADRYRLEGLVAVGGMALVFKATGLAEQRAVAIKVLRPELAAALGPERFLREIAVTAQLDHPGIVPLLDSGRAAGPTDGWEEPTANGERPTADLLYYIMPFVAGESLRARLEREGPLPLDDALGLTRRVAEALAHAHTRGVIHRDIKPENILLAGGRALVADFGIARAVEQAGAGGGTVTAPGVALGTPAYMSPEQTGPPGTADARSDIYSLGCVLYELLAGHPPFHGTTAQELIARHASDPVPSLRAARPTIPEPLEDVVNRALAKTPADRFATAAEFAAALAIDMPAYHRRRRATRVAGGAAVAALVVAGVSLAIWGPLGGMLRRRDDGRLPAPRPWVIVADFEGSADSSYRRTARDLVATALDQSPVAASLPLEQVRRGLRLSDKPETTTVTPELARELAVRAGIGAVVSGQVDRVGSTFAVLLRLVRAERGEVLAAEHRTAGDENALIPAIDSAVRVFRARLGEHGASLEGRWMPQVMTASFEAYQKYATAHRIFVGPGGSEAEAKQLLREAVSLDPNFASAWFLLGTRRGGDSAAREEAFRRPDRLTASQHLEWECRRLRLQVMHLSEALPACEQWVRESPNLGVAWNDYGIVVLYLRGPAAFLEILEQGAERQAFESWSIKTNRVWALIALGRWAEARQRVRSSPDPLSWALGRLASIAALVGDWNEVDSLVPLWEQAVLAETGSRPGGNRRATLHLVRGEVRRARAQYIEGDACIVWMLWQLATGSPITSGPDGTWRGTFVAALAGDTVAARTALRDLTADSLDYRVQSGYWAGAVEAAMATWHNDWRAVVEHTRPLRRDRPLVDEVIGAGVQWLAAHAYERMGRLDSAVAVLEAMVEPQRFLGEWNSSTYGAAQPYLRQHLIVLLARLGRVEEARRHWDIFRTTFTNPDPEYAHLIEEARAALERGGRGTD